MGHRFLLLHHFLFGALFPEYTVEENISPWSYSKVSDSFQSNFGQTKLDPLERLANSFEQIAKLMAQFYEKMYPPKQDARDVTLTRLPDTVDRIKQDQGATEESTDDWLSLEEEIGPREKEFIAKSTAE